MVSAISVGIIARNMEILCWGLVAAFHINFVQAYYYMYKKVFFAPLHHHLVRMTPAAGVVLGMVAYSLLPSLL
jgi:PST family polysaccharide transporter